jgi:hypothetical protein
LAQWQPDCEVFQNPALHIAKPLGAIKKYMNIFTLICLLGLCFVDSSAQSISENQESGKIGRIICTEPISDTPPLFVLKIKGNDYILDTTQVNKLEPTWIRKAVVSKSKNYGERGKNGVVLIIPKRNAIQEISEAIELKKITAPNIE